VQCSAVQQRGMCRMQRALLPLTTTTTLFPTRPDDDELQNVPYKPHATAAGKSQLLFTALGDVILDLRSTRYPYLDLPWPTYILLTALYRSSIGITILVHTTRETLDREHGQ
jgi:hypothetical protein